MQKLIVRSRSFPDGAEIPQEFTRDGADISPHISWEGSPENTASFVLICDDPDAPSGNWDHWILFNIPPDVREIQAHHILSSSAIAGARGGMNDYGILDYGGPQPPSGTHRYFFRVYALDVMLDLSEGCVKSDLLKQMKGHVLAEGKLLGFYSARS